MIEVIDEKSRSKLDELTRKSVDTLRFLAYRRIQAPLWPSGTSYGEWQMWPILYD
jgi:hypothetical protein